jgi:hypothetical protein
MSKHLILIGLCAVMMTGCKRELTVKQTVPVKGKVVFANGEPVRWAQLNLLTKDPNVGANCMANVKGDGTFEVRTYSASEYDGAVPGVYDVQIETYNFVASGPLPPNASYLWYLGPMLSMGPRIISKQSSILQALQIWIST